MPRKKPYSGKQKKKQLKEKRDRKLEGPEGQTPNNEKWKSKLGREYSEEENAGSSTQEEAEERFNLKTSKKNENVALYNPSRYNLNFLRESREEIERRKLCSQTEPIVFVSERERETSIEEVFQPGSELDMPQRPDWKYGISKGSLEKNETDYFSKYLRDIHSRFGDKNLSYFEHNLETWRQLWRVLEMSDIIAMVSDVRHPVLHFSPALYNYVVDTVKKPLILVLNKTDLVPASVVVAWRHYFQEKFPRLHVITFTSFPKDTREIDEERKIKKRRPVGKRIYTTQIGPRELLDVCLNVCEGKVDLTSWRRKIEEDLLNLHVDQLPLETGSTLKDSSYDPYDNSIKSAQNENLFKDGQMTIGFVGHPNVGKSSLMNGLIGKKVVSTSVTPGHTKYFQTYFLTETVKLCDCPGLSFPSLIAKQMQILSGIYPIAQVQEPYTPVGYLAARIPLVSLLKLTHPDFEPRKENKNPPWTAWDICESWAEKRRFYTAKAARPDVYRAANSILRMAVDGRLSMYMLPPGFTECKEKWIHHPETKNLLAMIRPPEAADQSRSSGDQNFVHDQREYDSDIDFTESSSSEESDSSCEKGDGDGAEGGLLTGNKFSILDGD